jgi:cardiolipin synthase
VKVFVALDAYGSDQLTEAWTQTLQQSGIFFRWFGPVLWSKRFYFSRRLHHKIFVADGSIALVGGINICNRYNDMTDDPAWHDWALFAEGEAVLQVQRICERLWRKGMYSKSSIAQDHRPSATYNNQWFCNVRVRRNDWVNGQLQISRSYLEMFHQAESRITIMSSYFLPGRAFRKAMQAARKRGVTIRVIVAGRSDVKTAKQAERYLYGWLLGKGIEIYEYQPQILHGKISTYDGKWVTVGSYNVNDISTYASVELNMEVLDAEFGTIAEYELNRVIQEDCIRITAELFDLHQAFFQRIMRQASYHFIRIVFFLFTFYFRQEKDSSMKAKPA